MNVTNVHNKSLVNELCCRVYARKWKYTNFLKKMLQKGIGSLQLCIVNKGDKYRCSKFILAAAMY
jgi:hypothetical protein